MATVGKKRTGVVGRPWKKGQSGNPSGRPKDTQGFRERARQNTGEALKVLEDALTAKRNPALWNMKIKAARTLLEFGWGTPKPAEDAAQTPSDIITGDIYIDARDGTDIAKDEPAHSEREPEPGTAKVPGEPKPVPAT